jgi:hypothetical protein
MQPILEAKGTVVWLDKNYHPVRIPPEVRSKFVQFIRHEDSQLQREINRIDFEAEDPLV